MDDKPSARIGADNETLSREEARDLLSDIERRILRHNVRNALTPIVINAQELADQLTGTDARRAEQLYELTRHVTVITDLALSADRNLEEHVLAYIRRELERVRPVFNILVAETEGEYRDRAECMLDQADDVLGTIDKIESTEELLDSLDATAQVDICQCVRDVVATYDEQHPHVGMTLDCPEACSVETVVAIEYVFENLIENAVEHTDGASPRVAISITEASDAVVVTVLNNDSGVPDSELDVVKSGNETQISHASGAGLWLVYVVVASSESDVQFTSDDGWTEATVRIPK